MKVLQVFLVFLMVLLVTKAQQRNIVFLLADDLGFNDVSWHNRDILTPNLESLAMSGIRLENYYVLPMCTPSRAALMTGYYSTRTGRHVRVLGSQEPVGLYTNFTLMPEYLNRLGYRSHIIGKWHLGFCHEDYLPINRGFHSFHGYHNAHQDYYLHATDTADGGTGYDFWANLDVDYAANNTYSTILFADRARVVISDHAANHPEQPLFLYVPFQLVNRPVKVPQEYIDLYPNIENEARRRYSGMVTAMDEIVGHVVDALKEAGLYENSIIIFSSDNGGYHFYGGNNYPLRGGKITVYEGGTRSPGFVHAPFLGSNEGTIYEGLMHITDWLPTLYSSAGGDTNDLVGIDGIDQWDSIINLQASKRTVMLYNIWSTNDYDAGPGAAIRVSNMKLICGLGGEYDDWIHPDNVTAPTYPEDEVHLNIYTKKEGRAISLTQSCMQGDSPVQLYDISVDPTEHCNIADGNPEVVRMLLERLAVHEAAMIEPFIAEYVDEGHPRHYGGSFSTGWCESEPRNMNPNLQSSGITLLVSLCVYVVVKLLGTHWV